MAAASPFPLRAHHCLRAFNSTLALDLIVQIRPGSRFSTQSFQAEYSKVLHIAADHVLAAAFCHHENTKLSSEAQRSRSSADHWIGGWAVLFSSGTATDGRSTMRFIEDTHCEAIGRITVDPECWRSLCMIATRLLSNCNSELSFDDVKCLQKYVDI